MIDFNKIKTGELAKYPFQTAAFYDLIERDTMETLRREYPKDNFIMYERRMGHDKTYKQCGRHLIIPGEKKPYKEDLLTETWRTFCADLLSDEYRDAMESLIGQSLKDSYIGVDLWRFDPDSGCYIAPHADVPWKICTHLFYMVKKWDRDWGGILSYHDCDKDDDVAFEVLPSMQLSPVLVRSDKSFHSIQPVNGKAPESRKVVDIVFYNQIPPVPKPGRLTSDILDPSTLWD